MRYVFWLEVRDAFNGDCNTDRGSGMYMDDFDKTKKQKRTVYIRSLPLYRIHSGFTMGRSDMGMVDEVR